MKRRCGRDIPGTSEQGRGRSEYPGKLPTYYFKEPILLNRHVTPSRTNHIDTTVIFFLSFCRYPRGILKSALLCDGNVISCAKIRWPYHRICLVIIQKKSLYTIQFLPICTRADAAVAGV